MRALTAPAADADHRRHRYAGPGFRRLCGQRGLAHVLTARAELDYDDRSIAAALDATSPGR